MGISLRMIAMACFTALGVGAAQAQNITGEDWGITKNGEKVSLFTLKSPNGLEARITNYGGRIVSLMVPNKQGGKTDVQLGYDISRLTKRPAIFTAPWWAAMSAGSVMAAAFP